MNFGQFILMIASAIEIAAGIMILLDCYGIRPDRGPAGVVVGIILVSLGLNLTVAVIKS